MAVTEAFQTKLSHLPQTPGVYLFKNVKEAVIYIGKALSLKERVRSYFQPGAAHSLKTTLMVSQISDLETISTESELEALLLESNLIKKYQPKYNIILRDDKHYPYLCLPITEDFPRLRIVRRVKKDGNLYFGPYVPSGAMRETVKWIKKYFPLATCNIEINGKAERACIEFQIKRCFAPCTGNQSKEEYREIVDQVRLFLEGKDKELLSGFKKEMEAYAGRENFEEAARIRDRIFQIKKVLERQRVSSTELEDQDVIALAREGKYADMQILFIRGGLLIGRSDFFWDRLTEEKDEELYLSFIEQFYAKERLIPKEIFVPLELPEKALMEKWLAEKRGRSVHLRSPGRGKDYRLLKMAEENARMTLQTRVLTKEGSQAVLKQMESLLKLKAVPGRIEGIDISNIMGTDAVGSLVVMTDGKMNKSEYRRYHIKTVEGANDFAMIHEIVTRRFGHMKGNVDPSANKASERLMSAVEPLPKQARREGATRAPTIGAFPDLMVIDGGKGQLSLALEALERAGISSLPVVGLAKEKGIKEERIYFPGQSEPMVLDPRSPVTRLLVQLRDEAHRFAVAYHRNLRGKRMIASFLDHIPGVGAARKKELLKHFKTVARIKTATLAELEEVKGISPAVARKLYQELHPME
ncbi:MAG: excinuclease ABC subunit UvrC [Nitrospirae bacterium]|nr:excinuclease ABC subunit UvrC [Nitrospirota bacterium]